SGSEEGKFGKSRDGVTPATSHVASVDLDREATIMVDETQSAAKREKEIRVDRREKEIRLDSSEARALPQALKSASGFAQLAGDGLVASWVETGLGLGDKDKECTIHDPGLSTEGIPKVGLSRLGQPNSEGINSKIKKSPKGPMKCRSRSRCKSCSKRKTGVFEGDIRDVQPRREE
ncbi:hypothetical protein Ancab_007699, partial [Ancistrocladus abbreviatus]